MGHDHAEDSLYNSEAALRLVVGELAKLQGRTAPPASCDFATELEPVAGTQAPAGSQSDCHRHRAR